MSELDIFNNAIHNLEKDIPITWDWKTIDPNKDTGIDGELDITLNDKKVLLLVEIKKDVRNHQILNILHNNDEFQNFLLVAEKLFPKVQKGGAVIIDNYFNFKGVKKATDEYFASKVISIKYYSIIARAVIYL